MRKLIFLFVLVSLVLPCAFAQNTVSRVTYFPISYVAYHNLNADQMDIGLGRSNAPSVSLGQDGADVTPLNVTGTGVDDGTMVNGGATLRLNGASVKVTGNSGATVGNGTGGTASLNFNNLKIGSGATMTSLNANTMNVSSLTLFGKDFPTCKTSGAKFDTNSEPGEMQWVSLCFSKNDTGSWYLACGDVPTEAQCSPGKNFTPIDQDYTFVYEWVFVRYGAKESNNMLVDDVTACPVLDRAVYHGTVDELVPCTQDLIDNVLHGLECFHGVNEDGYYKVWRCQKTLRPKE